MLPQKHLHYIDARLQQVKVNDTVFGGIIVVLIGDLAQLPPVKAVSLSDPHQRRSSGNKDVATLLGRSLWTEQFRTVIKLEQNKRLDEDDSDADEFNKFLEDLADGKVTMVQWEKVQTTCSRHTLKDRIWVERGFTNESTTHLFRTNADVQKKNYAEIQRLGRPILKVEATNSPSIARKRRPDYFQQVVNHEYYTVNSKVLLTKNLKPELGLANGTTGKVMDIVWKEGITDEDISNASNLFIWVDFGNNYTRETFFADFPERKDWFPVFAYECTNFEMNKTGTGSTPLSRTMLPLKLSWAWTIHKAQGQTIPGSIVLQLGSDEMTAGLSYVGFSRCIKFSSIGIDGGLSANRLVAKISEKPSLKARLVADAKLDKRATKTEENLRTIINNNRRRR